MQPRSDKHPCPPPRARLPPLQRALLALFAILWCILIIAILTHPWRR